MNKPRAQYQAPKLEVRRLRELPSALAGSGCHMTPSRNTLSCSTPAAGGGSNSTMHMIGQ